MNARMNGPGLTTVFVGGFSLPVPSAAPIPSSSPAVGTPGADGTWRPTARNRVAETFSRAREWLGERFLVADTTLKRRDHARWQRAEMLQDLCDLTAGWLTGQIASQPGYYGPVDVDEDDAPGLTEALVALNRIGFWTRTSQAGFDGEGYDGAHWTQLAAVDGFADRAVVEYLEHALVGSRFRIQAHPFREEGHGGVVVTRREGRAYTGFGGSMDDKDAAIQVAGVGERATEAVYGALQVVIWDPIADRNDLWSFLRQISHCPVPATARTDHHDAPPLLPAAQRRLRDQDMKETT